MPPEIIHEVKCGLGRFTVDEHEVVTQYDPDGVVVGIFKATDTPNLRHWISTEPSFHGKRGPVTLTEAKSK